MSSVIEAVSTAPGLSRSSDRSLEWLCLLMDEIDYGLLLWADGRATYANRVARRRLQEPGFPLTADGDLFRAVDADDHRALNAALADAVHRRKRRMLTLQGRHGLVAVAVVPFGPDADHGSAQMAMIVLGKRELCPELSLQWFCATHQLTPSESIVLLDVLAGHEPREIARRNGVALTTVRTQIATISDKTSLRGMRELIRAVAALPPVVAVESGGMTAVRECARARRNRDAPCAT